MFIKLNYFIFLDYKILIPILCNSHIIKIIINIINKLKIFYLIIKFLIIYQIKNKLKNNKLKKCSKH